MCRRATTGTPERGQLAGALRQAAPTEDLVAQLGGEGVVVLATDATVDDAALYRAKAAGRDRVVRHVAVIDLSSQPA